ncbi:MAG TPA: MATE family efflux transporter [Rhodopila sp.]|nr:MATE family efflux transporter [Rhodopila sp.]
MRPLSKEWIAEARALSGISVSVTITMFAQLAISAVETLAVARVGVTALAGVTLALGIYLLVFLFALGVVTAVTPIAAQARGRGDHEAVRLAGQHALYVGLSFSLPGAVLLSVGGLLLGLFTSSPEAKPAADYLIAAAWGLPAWVCYVAVRGFAVATGRVMVTTIIMLAAVPLHAGLTWWLVFGGLGIPPLGATGAGLAYSLVAYLAWGLLIVIVRAAPADPFSRSFAAPFTWNTRQYWQIVRLGIPFACRIVLREGMLPATAFVVAPFGPSALAAHAVAAQIVDLLGVFCFGFSDAANTRVGLAIGSGRVHHVGSAAWISVLLAAGVGLLVAGMLMAEPAWVVSWLLDGTESESAAAAAAVLPLAAFVLFLQGIQSAIGGALSGMRDAKGPLLIAVFGSWGIGLPLGTLLARISPLPVNGLWTGLLLGACVTTFFYVIRVRQLLRRLESPAPCAGSVHPPRPTRKRQPS